MFVKSDGILNVDLPHGGTPYSPSQPRNTLLTMDLPHRGTPYSQRTCSIANHPTHRGPTPQQNNLLPLDLPHMEHLTHLTEENLKFVCKHKNKTHWHCVLQRESV